MSDLFSEALKDSQKLREVAEQDAKNRLVEALSPYIKEMIAKEVSAPTDFFFEQEDEELEVEPQQQQADAPQPADQQGQTTDQQGMGGEMPTTEPAATTDTTGDLGADLGNQATTAPVSPEDEELADVSLPDEEGKITVDFEDLFIDDGSVTVDSDEFGKLQPIQATGEKENDLEASPEKTTQTGETAPVAPETVQTQQPEEEEQVLSAEGITFKEYQRVYSNVADRIDRLFFTESVSDINRETLKQRLFDLLEAIDLMKENGLINKKQARLQENKLEFLFIKLKEAGLHNSYNKRNQYKDTTMKSLKEFAAKLFEEEESLAKDTWSSGESGLKTDDEYSKHAADVSGVDPELGEREDVGAAGANNPDKNMQPVKEENLVDVEEPWEDGEPVVDEEDQDKTVDHSPNMKEASTAPGEQSLPDEDVAEGHAGFGDTDEEPVVSYEVDADELAEAVRDIKKESIRKKLQKLREASDGEEVESWEDADPEGGEDPSHDHLKEGTKMKNNEEEDVSLAEQVVVDDESGLEDDLDVAPDVGDEADLVLNVDLPPEVEEELAELGLDDDDFDVDVELNVGEVESGEEVEVVDDEPGSEEEEVLLADEDDVNLEYGGDSVREELGEASKKEKHLRRKNKLLERKLARAAQLLEEKENALNNFKKQLAETNLFTAKAVYYSKFLQKALNEKALNKKVLQQIVEHLDKGRTVAETKAIYKKIDSKLNEQKTASRKLDGSSSKVTKPGSANLTEGTAPQAGRNPDAQTPERWKLLAGIKS